MAELTKMKTLLAGLGTKSKSGWGTVLTWLVWRALTVLLAYVTLVMTAVVLIPQIAMQLHSSTLAVLGVPDGGGHGGLLVCATALCHPGDTSHRVQGGCMALGTGKPFSGKGQAQGARRIRHQRGVGGSNWRSAGGIQG